MYAIKDTFPLFVLAVIAVMLGDRIENTVNSFGLSAEGKVCSTPKCAQQCPYVHNLESLKILIFFSTLLLRLPKELRQRLDLRQNYLLILHTHYKMSSQGRRHRSNKTLLCINTHKSMY